MTRKRELKCRRVLRGSCIWFGSVRGVLTFCDDATPVLERDYLGLRLARRLP